MGCPTVTWVSLLAEIRELICMTGTSQAEPVSSSSALVMLGNMV